MKTFVDEVNKKINPVLVECTSEEWTFIKRNPHHYSLTTMVSSSTSTTTADRIINHTNTMVPNKVTSLRNEHNLSHFAGLVLEHVKSVDPFVLRAREFLYIQKFDCYRNGLNKEP